MTVGSYHAKTHLPALLKRVAKGEKILITIRGVPVAQLSIPDAPVQQNAGQIFRALLAYSKKQHRTLGTRRSLRELAHEGHRY